ncbi:S1 RNA-binding domain-containing protein [Streptomyces sp. NPDC002004]
MFVALDDGPDHPTPPGAGFITIPELSWRRIDAPTDVVEVGQRVSCEFLHFDTHNAEARLSLCAPQPDPFRAFADSTVAGQAPRGTVVRAFPFGVFVDIADGVVGLIPFKEATRPTAGLRPARRRLSGSATRYPLSSRTPSGHIDGCSSPGRRMPGTQVPLLRETAQLPPGPHLRTTGLDVPADPAAGSRIIRQIGGLMSRDRPRHEIRRHNRLCREPTCKNLRSYVISTRGS